MSQIASIAAHASIHSAAACQAARSGAYLLAPAQALGLHPTQPSTLRITCGQAWVTLGDGMDHFLEAGQTLPAPAGSRVVLESLHGTVLKFDWQATPQEQLDPSCLRGRADALAVQAGVSATSGRPLAQALRDLRGAAVLAARGLAGLATALLAGPVAVLARGFGAGLAALARKAASSAHRAHARMASGESMASSGAV
jgi:Protein of unknown function (DUF2917)